ncbi:MAG: ribonuclease H-like domain-containing protein [Syntrophobacteraceae bacterium]
MLQNTFVHLPGIGLKKEQLLWENGIHSWDIFCDENGCSLLPFSSKKTQSYREYLAKCRDRLCACDPEFFAGSLTSKLLWRLFSDFRQCAAFLDIETTGLGIPGDHITTAALYDGRQVFHYVFGDNLDRFADDLGKYKMLITYNGTCFDLPFIRTTFGIALNQVHIDLRYLLSSLGYKGGLKGCEKKLGLDRAELDGVDGYFAVLLWNEYRKKRNTRALETLLAYNIADTINLENLMVQAFNMKLKETPFAEKALALPCSPSTSFQPDAALISRLRSRYFGAF